jgi:hypothetical protein
MMEVQATFLANQQGAAEVQGPQAGMPLGLMVAVEAMVF